MDKARQQGMIEIAEEVERNRQPNTFPQGPKMNAQVSSKLLGEDVSNRVTDEINE